MERWERKEEYSSAYKQMILKYDWQWFGSFTLPVNDIQRISLKTISFMRKHQIGCTEAENLFSVSL
jgi:hypothetical protein